jgi:putative endonuclease
MYFVYILYSKSIESTYTGFTSDINQRLVAHKDTPTRTTARASDWNLVWYGVFVTRELAENFERYLKIWFWKAFMRKHLFSEEALAKSKPLSDN